MTRIPSEIYLPLVASFFVGFSKFYDNFNSHSLKEPFLPIKIVRNILHRKLVIQSSRFGRFDKISENRLSFDVLTNFGKLTTFRWLDKFRSFDNFRFFKFFLATYLKEIKKPFALKVTHEYGVNCINIRFILLFAPTWFRRPIQLYSLFSNTFSTTWPSTIPIKLQTFCQGGEKYISENRLFSRIRVFSKIESSSEFRWIVSIRSIVQSQKSNKIIFGESIDRQQILRK